MTTLGYTLERKEFEVKRVDSNRALHSLAVAKLMEQKAEELNLDKEKMFMLGWLHDIGYEFTDNKTKHPEAGGKFLESIEYEFQEEVKNHGNPDSVYQSVELDLLNYADMHIDYKGNYVTFEERAEDIKNRYGKDSIQYNNALRIIKRLESLEKINKM